MKFPEMGSLSGSRTILIAWMGVAAAWLAYLLGEPVMGQEVLTLEETIMLTFGALLAIFMRKGVKKAQNAAESAEKAVRNNGFRYVQKCLALCTLLPILFASTGCAGKVARDEVLMPAVRLAAPSVESDFDRGLADAVEDGDLTQPEADDISAQVEPLFQAIRDDDRQQVALHFQDWFTARPFAERGIQDRLDDGEISFGVAQSMQERLAQMEEALQKLSELVMAPPEVEPALRLAA